MNDEVFKIHNGWDNFPSPIPLKDKNSFYQDKNEETNKLAHWIKDTNGGSVLISGVRGVGKTAFVYNAIYRAQLLSKIDSFYFRLINLFNFDHFKGSVISYFIKQLKHPLRFCLGIFCRVNSIIFIPVNLASLKEDDKDKRLSLLVHLIQSYFYASPETRKQSKDLYFYAIAKSSSESQTNSEKAISLNTNLIGRMPLTIGIVITLILLIAAFINPDLEFYRFLEANILRSLDIRLLLTILIVIEFSFYLFFTWSKKDNLKIEFTNSNFNYLQMSFQQLLLKSNKTYVFVIDEIDKLPVQGENITELLQEMKNLLTISSGRFIFITTNEYYDHIGGRTTDAAPYPIVSTIFNFQIFIPQARAQDILNFLKSIIKPTLSDKEGRLVNIFAYYVYANTGGVFAKVKNTVREFLIYQNNQACLSLNIDSFDADKKRIARLGKIFENVYNQRYSPLASQQRYQHRRHEALFSVLQEVIKLASLGSENFSITKLCETHIERGYKYLSEREKELIRKDTRALLEDIKQRAKLGEEIPYNLPENDTDDFVLSLTLNQIQPNIDGVPSNRDELTEKEKELKSQIKKISEMASKYASNLDVDIKEIISNFNEGDWTKYEAAEDLAKSFDPRKVVSQIEVQNRIEEMSEIYDKLIDDFQFLNKYILKLLQGLEVESEDNIRRILSSLHVDNVNRILSKSLLYKYEEKYLIVSKSRTIKTLYARLKKVSISQNIAVALIEEDKKNDLQKLGFNMNKVVYSKISSHLKGARNLIESLEKIIDWKPIPDPSPSESADDTTD